jgi:hypothetical protein
MSMQTNQTNVLNAPLVQKHTPLITLLFPFVTVMVVHTDMAELIEYGYNRGVSTTNNLHVR